MRRSGWMMVVGLTMVLGVAVVGTPTAAAHGDEGSMTVLVVADAGGSTVHLEVGLVYTNDGEHAGAAQVTATLTGADGTVVGPVPVPHVGGESKFAADVPVPSPGTWSVALESTGPAATSAANVDIAAVVTTTAPTTVSATTAPTTEPTSASTSTSPVTATTSARSSGSDADEGPDDGSSAPVIIGAIAAAVLALGALAFRARATRDR